MRARECTASADTTVGRGLRFQDFRAEIMPHCAREEGRPAPAVEMLLTTPTPHGWKLRGLHLPIVIEF